MKHVKRIMYYLISNMTCYTSLHTWVDRTGLIGQFQLRAHTTLLIMPPILLPTKPTTHHHSVVKFCCCPTNHSPTLNHLFLPNKPFSPITWQNHVGSFELNSLVRTHSPPTIIEIPSTFFSLHFRLASTVLYPDILLQSSVLPTSKSHIYLLFTNPHDFQPFIHIFLLYVKSIPR